MSRSNPTANQPHPCDRWHEWDGSNGLVRHYDKEEKKNVEHKLPFTFIWLDSLATIKGWCDSDDAGIYSNEVRDTTKEPFLVKSFKGGRIIAKGFYQSIKDRVKAAGGHFTTNCYIGYKADDGKLHIGSLQFKGAALNAWVDFSKANRKALLEGAVSIVGFNEGKKGKIVFRTPKMVMKTLSPESNEEAIVLDRELQDFLKGYFARPTNEQAHTAANHADEGDGHTEPEDYDQSAAEDPGDEEEPF